MARDDASGGACPGCGAALPSGERLCSRCEVHWARHEAEADGLGAVEHPWPQLDSQPKETAQ
jgi:predicted amidophosphoribosyltransferase